MDLIELAILIAINGFIDIGLVAWMAGRRSKDALLNALTNPDERTQAAIEGLLETAWNWLEKNGKMAAVWNWLMTAQIETGDVIKTTDENGTEHVQKETTTPFWSVVDTIVKRIKMGILGKTGGDKANEKAFQQALAADLQNPGSSLSAIAQSALPHALARAQKTGDYGQLVQLLVAPYVQEWLKKRSSQQPQQGAGNNPLDLGGLRF
jgi:hypothetical protein